MSDFEKLGAFYLGKRVDKQDGALLDELVLYDAKDLTTHAFCVGMTGSGKTGLCVSLLEEAAIDGVPAIVIDPKGDLGNLALRFPELRAEDFLPYIDPGEASRKGHTPAEHATSVAAQWREGLAKWGQDGERIRRFRDAAEVVLYTPGSQIARPISIMRSLSAPPAALRDDVDGLRERVMGAVGGLLGMLGIEADPVRSREHIFLSNLLESAWRAGEDVSLADLVRRIQAPPFTRVGVMDLESFYPAKDRASLALGVNSILASPGFSAWLEGEPLDVGRLLRREDGHPRISILSIAHLDDAQRMFFVTLLLNEVIAWMRTQSGTSSLRAILYMDEVFGYLPPVANPSSKAPMLTLLKQARAFGLGVVLATQNPVDVDYKALSNCGTWLLGRLQTERDMARVLDGLAGASTATGAGFDRAAMEARLAGLQGRQFVLNNVHDAGPDLFQTRWALSYLRGPLTRDQLRALSRDGAAGVAAPSNSAAPSAVLAASQGSGVGGTSPASAAPDEPRPVLPAGITEQFLGGVDGCRYHAGLLMTLSLHYKHARTSTDVWQQASFIAPTLGRDPTETLASVEAHAVENLPLRDAPAPNARFAPLPAGSVTDKSWSALEKAIKAKAHREMGVTLYECKALSLWSASGEDHASFVARVQQGLREQRDVDMGKLRAKFEPKLTRLNERIARAEQKVIDEKGQVRQRQMDTAVNVGTTVLGALLGSRSVARAGTAVRSASRISREQQQVEAAEQTLASLQEQLAELEAEFQSSLSALAAQQPNVDIAEVVVRPTKSDLSVSRLDLLWIQE
ncbi:MAG: DUF87 domain-containing protein [Myxococcales bacterium]|nr:DUF87 domain-containing protein [Myxococcales bacterium]MCB9628997.1 DUF87 domain-containing protein [Sandaracinaceae bacterium]